MALAATVISTPGTNELQVAQGSLWQVFLSLVFSGSYTTGGETLDLTSFFPSGVGQIMAVTVTDLPGYTTRYDSTARRLLLYSAANTELAAGAYNAALTALRPIAMVWGK